MEKSPLVFGFILQSSMIMALGAQNLFVLEKGLLKDRALLVAAICSICDISLIFLGALGAGAFFAQNAILSLILKIAGSAFLLKYAYVKLQEAGMVQQVKVRTEFKATTVKAVVFSTLAVSLLNPHVYLDTIVLVGGYSTNFLSIEDKINFALGAGLFSTIWFFSIGLGASFFSTTLKNPNVMKYVNYATSAIMAYLGVSLLLSM